jgi:hypothetical protein
LKKIDWADSEQSFLDFDFVEQEKNELKDFVSSLKSFENPKNEQERLFNFQKQYKSGDDKALVFMYLDLCELAQKILDKSSNAQIRALSSSQKELLAIKSSDEIIERQKKLRFNKWAICSSWYSYILQTLNAFLYLREDRSVFDYDLELFGSERNLSKKKGRNGVI